MNQQNTANRRKTKTEIPATTATSPERSHVAAAANENKCNDNEKHSQKKWSQTLRSNRMYLCMACAAILIVYNCWEYSKKNGAERRLPTTTQRNKKLDGKRFMEDAGYTHRPRIIGCDGSVVGSDSRSVENVNGIDHDAYVNGIDHDASTRTEYEFSKKLARHTKKEQRKKEVERRRKRDDDDDSRGTRISDIPKDWLPSSLCEPRHEWQSKSFPTCNIFHEQDMKTLLSSDSSSSTLSTKNQRRPRARVSYVASGAIRDVWRVSFPRDDDDASSGDESVALKTLTYRRPFSEKQYDRHRRDAVANERLTSSRFVAPIYGACGNSALVEFADDGTLGDILRRRRHAEFNCTEKLVLGYQAAAAVSDVHNTDSSGRASMCHTDVKPSQYIYAPREGIMKLTDFNRCKFIEQNKASKKPCPFEFGGTNWGKHRSPEECRSAPLTEKIDVFQLGNVLYTILTGKWPFEDYDHSTTSRYVTEGRFPPVADRFRNSTNIAETTLLRAMKMSWVHDPTKRASSTTVKSYLHSKLQKLGLDDRIFFSQNEY